MIVQRRDICVSEPWRGGCGIDMISGASLIKSNDEKRMRPVRARGHQRHEGLKKRIALGSRSVVHIVGHVGRHKGKVDGRIEIREPLNVCALV